MARKTGLILLTLMALALLAAPLRADRWNNVVYSQNTGATMADAIVITGAKDDSESTKSEYVYLAHHFPHYTMGMQSLLSDKGHDYDLLEFTDVAGKKQKIYFDITDGMKKLEAELKTAKPDAKSQTNAP